MRLFADENFPRPAVAAFREAGLARDIGAQFEYSNLGGGLLGHALARAAGVDYEALIRSRICEPLVMKSTIITLTREMQKRLAIGHNDKLTSIPGWDLRALAGAGVLRSTANDLLNFLAANLDYSKSTLAPAMTSMLKVRTPSGSPGLEIGLGWHTLNRSPSKQIAKARPIS